MILNILHRTSEDNTCYAVTVLPNETIEELCKRVRLNQSGVIEIRMSAPMPLPGPKFGN